jgi:hypothetical protein
VFQVGNDKEIALVGFLTCRKILLQGADGFTFNPKEGVLRIFIAPKNPSPSAGSEQINLVSTGKNANHYTSKASDKTPLMSYILVFGLRISF